MTNIRLLALDMDGTTLTSDNRLTMETEKWIQKVREKGITVIFATGRGADLVKEFQSKLKLYTPQVLLNGSLIINADGEIKERYFLEKSVVDHLFQLAFQHDCWFWGYTSKGRYHRGDWQNDWVHEAWHKIGLKSENKETLEALRKHLKDWGTVEVTSSGWDNLEINPKGVSKASGVKSVCEELGITMNDVMAIGDSLNDYPLFKEAAISVAMENADPLLKSIATDSTRSNNEDGVADAIQRILF